MKGRRKITRHRKMKAAIKRRNRQNGGIGIASESECDGRDRMSELPKDILISIISRLPLREATATSLVCSRWRYLHSYVTHLDFPPFKPNLQSEYLHDFQRTRFIKHVNMINRVLTSHRCGVGLKGLRLCMYRMRGCSMKKWVQFALTKEIEIIDIQLPSLPTMFWKLEPHGRYSLGLSKLMMKSILLPGIKCLKQLTLHWVKVTDQEFDILISNFLTLESISIRDTYPFKKAPILGHPRLMHVDIPCESLEIRSVANLVSLRVGRLSSEGTVEVENIPKLTQFYSYESKHSLPHSTLYTIIPSNIRDQLQAIHLQSHGYWVYIPLPTPFQFDNVKHLELEVESMHDRSGVAKFFRLIAACSSLEKLKIKLLWSRWDAQLIEFEERSSDYHPRHAKKLSPKLKVLEMKGYAGSESEFELAAGLVTCHAMNLERVIVVACDASKRIRRRSLARAQQDFQLFTTPPSLHLQFI